MAERKTARRREQHKAMDIDLTLVLRWLHIIGATMLLGTGAGIAFFMLMAHRTRDALHIARTADSVVLGDMIFTLSAVVIQPITGSLLALRMGWSLTEGWIMAALALYGITGLFWIPVIWIQKRMRDLAWSAAAGRAPLPRRYYTLFRIWFACGIPAFLAVLAIIWLMIARPML